MAKLRLITIPPSHYCEKARWALDRVGAHYVEERHAPLLHLFATVRYARLAPRDGGSRWGDGRGRTVPILVTPHGVLRDSSEILRHLDAWIDEPVRLRPHGREAEVDALENQFDTTLGPQTRRWVYAWLLDHEDTFVKTLGDRLGPFESILFKRAAPRIRLQMKRGFRIDEGTGARALERIQVVFKEVGDRLADGRPYLAGDRFTSADLSFAALAVHTVVPPEYGAYVPPIASLPKHVADAIYALRDTRAGAHILKMYKEERPRVVARPDAT